MAVLNTNTTLRMPNARRDEDKAQDKPQSFSRDANEFVQSFNAMLNVMRRMYDLWGDPEIKRIIDKAEGSLARR